MPLHLTPFFPSPPPLLHTDCKINYRSGPGGSAGEFSVEDTGSQMGTFTLIAPRKPFLLPLPTTSGVEAVYVIKLGRTTLKLTLQLSTKSPWASNSAMGFLRRLGFGNPPPTIPIPLLNTMVYALNSSSLVGLGGGVSTSISTLPPTPSIPAPSIAAAYRQGEGGTLGQVDGGEKEEGGEEEEEEGDGDEDDGVEGDEDDEALTTDGAANTRGGGGGEGGGGALA